MSDPKPLSEEELSRIKGMICQASETLRGKLDAITVISIVFLPASDDYVHAIDGMSGRGIEKASDVYYLMYTAAKAIEEGHTGYVQ